MQENPTIHAIDRYSLIIMAVLSPLFLMPRPRLWFVILIIPVLAGVRLFVKRELVEKTLVDLPLFIILAATVVSMARITDLGHSLGKSAGLVFGIFFLYVAAGFLKTGKLLKWGVVVFLCGGFCFSIIGLLGMPTFTVKHLDVLMKIKQHLPHINFNLAGAEMGFSTNAVGGTLLFVLPLFFLLAVYFGRKSKEINYGRYYLILCVTGCGVIGLVLLLTQSRGAWLGLFLSTLIIGTVQLLRRFKAKQVVAVLVISVLVLTVLTGAAIYSVSYARHFKPGIKQVEGTLQFRIHLWNITLPVIRENPWFGVGLNNFRQAREVRYFWSSAHNQFLHVAVELGIPALIGYLTLLLMIGYMSFEIRKRCDDFFIRTTALGLGWGQLAFVFFGLTDAVPPGAKVGVFFWLSLALTVSFYNYVVYHSTGANSVCANSVCANSVGNNSVPGEKRC